MLATIQDHVLRLRRSLLSAEDKETAVDAAAGINITRLLPKFIFLFCIPLLITICLYIVTCMTCGKGSGRSVTPSRPRSTSLESLNDSTIKSTSCLNLDDETFSREYYEEVLQVIKGEVGMKALGTYCSYIVFF